MTSLHGGVGHGEARQCALRKRVVCARSCSIQYLRVLEDDVLRTRDGRSGTVYTLQRKQREHDESGTEGSGVAGRCALRKSCLNQCLRVLEEWQSSLLFHVRVILEHEVLLLQRDGGNIARPHGPGISNALCSAVFTGSRKCVLLVLCMFRLSLSTRYFFSSAMGLPEWRERSPGRSE